MTNGGFRFGIEIELLLASKKHKARTFQALAEEVSKRLSKAGIPNHITESNDKSPGKYRKWSIVQEISIESTPTHYGIELVSPIYTATATSSTTSSNPSWATDLAVLFSALHKHFHLAPSPSCATHIHVSRVPPLSGNELAALAKAALYFEPAVDRLVPPFRRGGGGDSGIGGGGGETRYWCRSNRASAALMALSLAGCLARLDDQLDSFENEAAAAVAETMNLVSRDSPVGRAKGKTADFVHGKLFKWNFAGVLPGGSGTVEFRQPAGCLAAGDAAAWVRFKLAFVAGAVRWGPGLGRDGVLWPEAGESLEELWGMLDTGRRELRWERLEGVEALFQGAQESVSLC